MDKNFRPKNNNAYDEATETNLTSQMVDILKDYWKTREDSTVLDEPEMTEIIDKKMPTARKLFGRDPVKAGDELLMNPDLEQVSSVDIPWTNNAEFHMLSNEIELSPSLQNGLKNVYKDFANGYSIPKDQLENPTDYRYSLGIGNPVPLVRFDMATFSENENSAIPNLDKNELDDLIKSKVFEIETTPGGFGIDSVLIEGFHDNVDELFDSFREKYDKPVVMLAVEDGKYEDLLKSDLGFSDEEIKIGKRPTPELVREIIGVDDLWSYDDYEKYIKEDHELDEDGFPKNHPLLYVKSSPSKSQQENRSISHNNNSRSFRDPETRKIARAFAINPGIDNPISKGQRQTSENKLYMAKMGMGMVLDGKNLESEDSEVGIWLDDDSGDLRENPDDLQIVDDVREYVEKNKLDPNGDFDLRAKPVFGSWGARDQMTWKFHGGKPGKTSRLYTMMEKNGSYLLQPEIPIPTEEVNGVNYGKMLRIYAMKNAMTGEISLAGGLELLIAENDTEFKKGRIHDQDHTLHREILVPKNDAE